MTVGASRALPPGFIDSTKREFPVDFASIDPLDLQTYGRDWTKVFPPQASMLCRPRTTDEVSRLMRLCAQHRVPVVPSGGRTGLACGALATGGELVLSLERMQRMEPVDSLGRTVRVQAGAVIEAVNQHCADAGLFWPIELESTGSQIGGSIATNAGGMRVVRYGLTRHWVLGLTVVLANGNVLQLNGALEKNNTGVDLRQLFIGSEGILGVITEATLKLSCLPQRIDVLLLALTSLEAVLQVFERARKASFTLLAYEFFTDTCLARVLHNRRLEPPFDEPFSHYVMLEVSRGEDPIDGWLESLVEAGLVTAGTQAQGSPQAESLWTYREAISESLIATGMPRMHSIALPIARLQAFCIELDKLIANSYSDFELCLFGPIGDGNLHVNVMKPEEMDKRSFLTRSHLFDSAMFDLVRSHQGGVSAEHGIGLLKKAQLGLTCSANEIELMRALKRVMDPLGILNPGKVL